jgi:branched-chain amino acid transport system permease protein
MISYALTILLDGVSFGMVLFVISVGLTVTMGMMRVVNLAHGSFAMAGGYIAAMMTQQGIDFHLAVATATVVVGLLGGACEIVFYRPLYRKGDLAQVLLTVGLVFVSIAAVTAIFGAHPYPMVMPQYMQELVDIGFRTYPAYRLFVLAVGTVAAAILWYVIEYSLVGARVRAAVDNPRMARGVGMNVNLLFSLSFIVGCALAGLGGAIGAGMLSLEPTYALKYIVLFLVVVIVGGEGSFKGSFVAAIAIGVIDTLGRYFLPDVAPYMIYVAVFFLLLWRPKGLLPPKSVA